MRADAAKALLRTAPVRSFEELVGPRPLLVLAPHQDDESLGCGGLIAEACQRAHPVFVVMLTDGGLSHPGSPSWPRDRLVAARAREVAAALRCLGLDPDRLIAFDEPDGSAPVGGPALDAVAERLRRILVEHDIGTVAATWTADPHGDHVSAARAAAAACAATGARRLSYPIWAWMRPGDDEVPDVTGRAMRLNVAQHRTRKREAIACHATQHAGLITDDPSGFTLPPEFLAQFDGPDEFFIAEP